MHLRLLTRSATRSLRALTPTTTAGIHTAFPASFAHTATPSAKSGSHGTAAPTPSQFQTHTTDVYSKDVDSTPPDNTKLHSINPEAEVENVPASLASAPSASGEQGVINRPGASTTVEQKRVNTVEHPYSAPGGSQNYGNLNQ